jgi:hypothetical protein
MKGCFNNQQSTINNLTISKLTTNNSNNFIIKTD